MELRFYCWYPFMLVRHHALGNEIVLRTENERKAVLDIIELGSSVYSHLLKEQRDTERILWLIDETLVQYGQEPKRKDK